MLNLTSELRLDRLSRESLAYKVTCNFYTSSNFVQAICTSPPPKALELCKLTSWIAAYVLAEFFFKVQITNFKISYVIFYWFWPIPYIWLIGCWLLTLYIPNLLIDSQFCCITKICKYSYLLSFLCLLVPLFQKVRIY